MARLSGLAVVAAFLAGTATTEREPPVADRRAALPTLRLKTERARPDPVKGQCPAPPEVTLVRGPVPDEGEVVATLTLTAVDKAAPLATYESVLREWAAEHCCVGVSMLQAEALGAGGAIAKVTAAVWTDQRPREGAPSADEERPTPEEQEEAFWE